MSLSSLQSQIALGEDSKRQFKRDMTNADVLAAEMAASPLIFERCTCPNTKL